MTRGRRAARGRAPLTTHRPQEVPDDRARRVPQRRVRPAGDDHRRRRRHQRRQPAHDAGGRGADPDRPDPPGRAGRAARLRLLLPDRAPLPARGRRVQPEPAPDPDGDRRADQADPARSDREHPHVAPPGPPRRAGGDPRRHLRRTARVRARPRLPAPRDRGARRSAGRHDPGPGAQPGLLRGGLRDHHEVLDAGVVQPPRRVLHDPAVVHPLEPQADDRLLQRARQRPRPRGRDRHRRPRHVLGRQPGAGHDDQAAGAAGVPAAAAEAVPADVAAADEPALDRVRRPARRQRLLHRRAEQPAEAEHRDLLRRRPRRPASPTASTAASSSTAGTRPATAASSPAATSTSPTTGIGDMDRAARALEVQWDYYGPFGFAGVLAEPGETVDIGRKVTAEELRATRRRHPRLGRPGDRGDHEDQGRSAATTTSCSTPGSSWAASRAAEIEDQMRCFAEEVMPVLRARVRRPGRVPGERRLAGARGPGPGVRA